MLGGVGSCVVWGDDRAGGGCCSGGLKVGSTFGVPLVGVPKVFVTWAGVCCGNGLNVGNVLWVPYEVSVCVTSVGEFDCAKFCGALLLLYGKEEFMYVSLVGLDVAFIWLEPNDDMRLVFRSVVFVFRDKLVETFGKVLFCSLEVLFEDDLSTRLKELSIALVCKKSSEPLPENNCFAVSGGAEVLEVARKSLSSPLNKLFMLLFVEDVDGTAKSTGVCVPTNENKISY